MIFLCFTIHAMRKYNILEFTQNINFIKNGKSNIELKKLRTMPKQPTNDMY